MLAPKKRKKEKKFRENSALKILKIFKDLCSIYV